MADVDTSVLISTFYRNDLLEQLLRHCDQQQGLSAYAVEYVIVDNSDEAVARPVVEALQDELSMTLRYFHEPQRGLAYARNRGIKESRGQWLVFIDDDEVPASNWLATLRTAVERYQADAVFGPVFPELMPSDSEYRDEAAAFFTQNSPVPTGAPVVEPSFWNRRFRRGVCTRITASNNCIFSRAAVETLGDQPVDPETSQYGASDQVFFNAMRANGYGRFIWCAEAHVSEAVPPDRQTREYLLNRSFKHGQMSSNVILREERVQYVKLAQSMAMGVAQATAGAMISCAYPVSRQVGFRGHRLLNVGLGRVLFFGPFRRHLYGKAPSDDDADSNS